MLEEKNKDLSLPPCQGACPLHQDIRGYVRAVAIGDLDEAARIIRKDNPLAAVCGTICAHHCEDECRRNNVDKPISIRAIKRFALESGRKIEVEAPSVRREEKVAVIGSGPSGLTAAWDLASEGYQVTVFEREEAPGGALRQFIPLYRLPDSIIDEDIKLMESIGVEFRTGVEFGTDISPEDLKKQGYKAIILALGLPSSRGLPIPGADLDDVMYALPFLNAVKRQGFKFDKGREVIVIGGGNVAMDVCRSAVRCGADKVKVVCLESRDEMPAFPWEIEEAIEEGVEIYPSWGPVEILNENGKITGLKLKECTAVFDDKGRFNPQFNEENTTAVDGNTVIFAIGQASDLSSLKNTGIEYDERGRLVFDPQKMTTSMEGIFACGEVVTGPGTAVQAMANGRLVAQAVSSYLNGEEFSTARIKEPEVLPQLDQVVAEKVKRIDRVEVPLAAPEKRATNFEMVDLGYQAEQAVCEGKRCLGCGAGAERLPDDCANCLTCLRVCPYGVPVIGEDGVINIRNEQCQACGLCVGICPNIAIEFKSSYIKEAENQIEPAIREVVRKKNGKPVIAVFCCTYGEYALEDFKGGYLSSKPDNVAVVRFPCVAKIDTLHLLKAFELGADAVLVAGCKDDEDDDCPYQKAKFWAERRVGRVKGILNDLDLGEERIAMLSLSADEIKQFAQSAGETLQKFEEMGSAW